jgi:hypothetical protein
MIGTATRVRLRDGVHLLPTPQPGTALHLMRWRTIPLVNVWTHTGGGAPGLHGHGKQTCWSTCVGQVHAASVARSAACGRILHCSTFRHALYKVINHATLIAWCTGRCNPFAFHATVFQQCVGFDIVGRNEDDGGT